MPKISIIVPVYNVEKYIDKCLKSLVNQTLQDIEIIIVNDGSLDKSVEIIKKYVKENPTKINYYEKENGGLSSARNYGLEYATGEYIAFLDSDDYVDCNMYEEMYSLAKKENADMLECDFIWEWEYGKKIFDKRREYKTKEEMMKKPRVVAWNKIYKREIINKYKIRFPEGLIYEDMEFFYKLLPHLNKVSYINKYFVHYIQREDSITNKQTQKVEDIFKILDNIFDYYIDQKLYNKYEKELKYMSRRILLGSSLKRIFRIKDSHLRRKMFLKTIIYVLKFRKSINDINNKKKICFGITKLGIGGAERVLVDITNELIKDYDITIFTIYGGGELEKELNPNIKRISLYKNEKKSVFIPIYVLFCGKIIYKKYLKGHFDIDIAFLEGSITRIFAYKGNNNKIGWVHNDISKVFGKDYKSKIKKYIDKWFYNKYDKIIFVSEQNKKSFENVYGNISERKIIYNYINKERVLSLSKEKCDNPINFENEKIFITVSRLVKQKAIDRLIKVHKRLIDEGLNHKIYVIGDGEEWTNLTRLAKELSVDNSFIFLGKKENPYPYINKADYFVLLSYFEGYGMVLEEAKILNKPILVTNTAAKEAVMNYDKKIIIENKEDDIFDEMRNVLQGKYIFLDEENKSYNYDNKYLLDQIKNVL
ncbi:MAG: glycosyltransferase [Clostridia bacterium]|nr:glycosyltransferase [Clostridia bacterium]